MEKSQDPKAPLYAVYGTLRKGFGNYERLLNNKHCTYLGTQMTEPKFTMVSLGGFPGVIPAGNNSVRIEVFRVDSKDVEQRLDWLEGYPRFYQKMEINTKWGKANMYILSEKYLESHSFIESGDWAQYIGKEVRY